MSSELENLLLRVSEGTMLEDDVREYMRQNFSVIYSYDEIKKATRSSILNMLVKIIYLLIVLTVILFIGFLILRYSIQIGEDIIGENLTDLTLLITLSPFILYIVLMIRHVITIILYILVLILSIFYALLFARAQN